MADEKELTRRELSEALDRATAMIAEQGKQIAALMAVPAPAAIVPTAGPQKVPYQGLVRAKVSCFIGVLRLEGDVWEHEAECLWDDDPFEPCVITSMRDDGKPNTALRTDAPKPIPKELRPRTPDVLAARGATPLTASQW